MPAALTLHHLFVAFIKMNAGGPVDATASSSLWEVRLFHVSSDPVECEIKRRTWFFCQNLLLIFLLKGGEVSKLLHLHRPLLNKLLGRNGVG